MSNEFSQAKQFYELGPDINKKEIFESGNHLPS
jgi:hypothetical protein